MHLKDFFRIPEDKIEPASKAQFIKLVGVFLSMQIGIIFVLVVAFNWAGQYYSRDLQYSVFILTIILELFLYKKFKGKLDYRRRLLDLYPQAEMPGRVHLSLVTWAPFLFFPVVVHMMLAKRSPNTALPWIYRNRKPQLFFMVLVSGLIFILSHFSTGNFGILGSPSVSYIGSLVATVASSIEAGEQMRQTVNTGGKPAFAPYFLNGDLSSTKMILGLAAYMGAVEKYKSRLPASESVDAGKALVSFYSTWNPQRSPLYNISPLSLLTPASLMEASVLALVDMKMADASAEKLIQSTEAWLGKKSNGSGLLAELHTTSLFKSAEASRNSQVVKLLAEF